MSLRSAATAVCLMSLTAVAACNHDAEKNSTGKSVFRINLSSGALESLDPAYAKDLYTMWTTHMLYNTLVEADTALQLQPSLAKRWESSPDGLIWTFHLRSDVFFHDNEMFPEGKGRRMVAGDAAYSFQRLIDPQVASSGAWIFNDRIASENAFQAIDDTTLIIQLKQPFRALPMLLSMPYCSVIPKEIATYWGSDFRRHPCGTGPFRFSYWDEGTALTFHKNPHYWERDAGGAALPYLDAVQLSFFDSKATEFLLFLQHEIHFINGIDGSFKDLVLARNGTLRPAFAAKYNLKKSTYLNTEYIGILNDTSNPVLNNSPLKNRLVRQAMNYAIDRPRIARYFRNGVGIPATGGFIPLGLPGCDSTGNIGYHYNPGKADSLLAAAGYPKGKGLAPIAILVPDNWADIVNFITIQLAEVGIPCRAEIMQPNILRQQMSSEKAPAFRAQWIADYPEAETYMAFFYSKLPAPPNYTRYNNKQFDIWYEQSTNLPDSERHLMYHRMDSLVISDAPVVPLFYDQLLHFTQKNVEGFMANPMNLIELKHVRLKPAS